MEEKQNSSNNSNTNNIAFKIKQLLLNYDMTIAYILGEIDLRENQIKMIDLTVGASDSKKETKKQKKRKIFLKADIEVYENTLADIIKRRDKLTNNISLILERLNTKRNFINSLFIDYYLKDNLTKEEIVKKYNLESSEELQEIINTIDRLLISNFRY